MTKEQNEFRKEVANLILRYKIQKAQIFIKGETFTITFDDIDYPTLSDYFKKFFGKTEESEKEAE